MTTLGYKGSSQEKITLVGNKIVLPSMFDGKNSFCSREIVGNIHIEKVKEDAKEVR